MHYYNDLITAKVPTAKSNLDFAVYQNPETNVVDIAWFPNTLIPKAQQFTLKDFTTAELNAAELAGAKRNKIDDINRLCTEQIYAGFTSSALGTPHLYPAQDKDQMNLQASILASALPNTPANWTTPFWCQDVATGTWNFTPHTIAQIQQVGLDGKNAISAALIKNATLSSQVTATQTLAGVSSINW